MGGLLVVLVLSSCIDPINPDLARAAADSEEPLISVARPQDGAVYGRTVTVTGTVADLDGARSAGRIDLLSYTLVGTDIGGEADVAADGSFTISIQTDDLQGDLELLLSASDWNDNTFERRLVLRDDEAGPHVAITSPGDGSHFTATVNAQVRIESAEGSSDVTEVRRASWRVLGTGFSDVFIEEDSDRSAMDGNFSLSFETTGLSGPQTIEVTAEDWNGYRTVSTVTLIDADSTIPSLTVDASQGSMVLDWDPLPDVDTYTVYYTDDGSLPSPSYGNQVTVGAPPATISGLENGREHVFLLEATMNAGPANYSPYVRAIPLSDYALAPIVRPDSDAIDLSWPALGAGVRYEVLRSTSRSGPFVNISGSLAGNSFRDSLVDEASTYFYRVRPFQQNSVTSVPVEARVIPVVSPDSRIGPFTPIAGTEGNAIAITGDRVYVGGSGPGVDLSIFDVVTPSGTVLLGSFEDPNTSSTNDVYDIAVQTAGSRLKPDLFAYLAKGSEGIISVDVTDPVNPTAVDTVAAPTNAEADLVEAVGPYVAVAYRDYGVIVYHTSDGTMTPTAEFTPTNPADFYTLGTGMVLDYDETSEELHIVVADSQGTHRGIYTATVTGSQLTSLKSIENVTETLLTSVGTVNFNDSGSPEPPVLLARGSASTLFIATDRNPTRILSVDITNPGSPTLNDVLALSTVGATTIMSPAGMNYGNGFLSIINNSGTFPTGMVRRIDVSDPSAMTETVAVNTNTNGFGIVERADVGYIADQVYGLREVDLTPTPRPVVRVDRSADDLNLRSVLMSGDLVFATDSDRGTPLFRVYELNAGFDSAVEATTAPVNAAGGPMVRVGDVLYVGTVQGDQRLYAFDISVPTTPVLIGELDLPDTFGGAGSLERIGQYLYLTDGGASVLVIDAGDPTQPSVHRSLPAARDSELVLDYPTLYVTRSAMYDVSNPAEPTLLRSVSNTEFRGREGFVSGEYLYLEGNEADALVYILDKDDPSVVIDSIPASGSESTFPQHVSFMPGFLLFGGGDLDGDDENGIPQAGLRLYSLSDPVQPRLVQLDTTRDTVLDVHVFGNRVAAVGGDGDTPRGLVIYRLE